jgi:hydrogenase small subunit
MSVLPNTSTAADEAMPRREFLRIGTRLAALWGLGPTLIPGIASAVDDLSTGRTPVLWLEGSNCSGCSISLLNSYPLLPLSLLTKHISLKFHQTLSTTTGQQAQDVVNGTIAQADYILVVEGAVPTLIPTACTFGGEPFKDHLLRAAGGATAVVAVGACAAFGGIPAAPGNPTGAMDAITFLQQNGVSKPFIRIPGCPPHPDWMIGTLVHVIKFGVPPLDAMLRPTKFFGPRIHDQCPYRNMPYATKFGDVGCQWMLGCHGPTTRGDCVARGFNNGTSSCLHSLGPCIGCTQPDFGQKQMYQWPPV